jgi:cell division protein ZapA (FtsZ GTPase activity inhibitor)
MAEEKQISINVWLAGRSYRIRIKPEEEEAIRKAVKLADDKVVELRNSYAGKDDQDFLAMCLLMYASDAATGASDPIVQKEIKNIIKKIEKITG